jgi:sRNA-binding protein
MKSEFSCGIEESPQQIAVLREKWPLAFPVKPHDVRPLAVGVTNEIAATMGWSLPYARGVLVRWKMAATYCRAVLWCDHRIALDGTPAEPVDAEAKDLAAKQLAKLTARKATKKAAEAAKSAPPPPPPPEPPKPFRDQIRASLLRRRSA